MVDTVEPKVRSRIMSRIRGKNTKPEMAVRRFLHRAGLRFRLHRRDLPGTPDIVLPRFRAVVFVHGCFWHRHRRCKRATIPSSNRSYWLPKLRENMTRDRRQRAELEEKGWHVHIVWECEVGEQRLVDLLREIRRSVD